MSDHKLEAHLFICTNKRNGKECCADKGGAELRDSLKKLVKEKHPEWKGRVRINAAGCLDRCSEGIAAVLYPQGTWFEHLTEDSVAHLENELSRTLDKK